MADDAPNPSLSVMMMPSDANVLGTIFGGTILSYIDNAGFVEARRHGLHRWVTASMERVDFRKPVRVGDIVHFMTTTAATGTSSVTVDVVVEAERYTSGKRVLVTEASLTMVSVDASGAAIPFSSPPTVQLPPGDEGA